MARIGKESDRNPISRRRRAVENARDFTRLLSAAFATTAALGGMLAFLLFSLYPRYMAYLTGVFHKTFSAYPSPSAV